MISTKGRYALRVMIDLAEQRSDDYVPLTEIAKRQELSLKYLEIILKILVEKKLLTGRRGKGGGYRLTRPPEDYSVWEILELTEGSLATVACLEKNADPCPRRSTCRTFTMWEKFDALVHDYFSNISLSELMDETEPSVALDEAVQWSRGAQKYRLCSVRMTKRL